MELRQLHALLACTRDHRHQLHVLGLQQGRRELAVRVAAQAAERETEGLAAGLRRAQRRSEGITRGEAAEGTEESTTSRAHRGESFSTPACPPRKCKVGAAPRAALVCLISPP